MKDLVVQVQDDHVQKLIKASRPSDAIAEMIWNAFDADSQQVDVSIYNNEMGSINQIIVTDDGHGIDFKDTNIYFSKLGGSWKKHTSKTKNKKRLLHGKNGEGRFKIYNVGGRIEWSTVFYNGENYIHYNIIGKSSDIRRYSVGDQEISKYNNTGTIVTVDNIRKDINLKEEAVHNNIVEEFALYVNEYRNTEISLNKKRIDFGSLKKHEKNFQLSDIVDADGSKHKCTLRVIEWLISIDRTLCLCDNAGFTLEKTIPGIHAPGFNFTAYIQSGYFKKLHEKNNLQGLELYEGYRSMLQEAKDIMRDHFREMRALETRSLVEKWKDEEVYPYAGDPKDIIETTERQVFDICALNVHEYLPGFKNSDSTAIKFSFQLLKNAIEENPKALKAILNDVLRLPIDKQDDLAELLEKTTLSSIVNAAKIVSGRLDFLKGLELLLFEPISKKCLLERSQLHKILKNETWLFGEQYRLSVDDESLNTALTRHLNILDKERKDLAPVVDLDGKSGVLDIMLSRLVASPNKLEHLVVELKRPKVKIGQDQTNQIENYALAVAKDDRFRSFNVKWNFFLISNELEEVTKEKVNQPNRPKGLLFESHKKEIYVWVKEWGEVIQECQERLKFFQEKLDYNATMNGGREYLNKTHEKYLPDILSSQEEEPLETSI